MSIDIVDNTDDKATDIKTKSDDVGDALSYLDINRDELESSQKVSFKISGDKLFDCQNISREYKATMEGKSRVDEGNTETIVYKQTGKALASKTFIHLTYSMLNSFADTSNISSSKKFEEFFIQLRDAFNKVRDMGLRDEKIRDREFSAIITLFKQKLVNIGQIITNEEGNMKLLLEKARKSEMDDDFSLGLESQGGN